LVIGEIIALARQLGDRSNEMHNGTWNKVSNKCWEIRGKTLGRYPSGTALVKRRLMTMLQALSVTVILAPSCQYLRRPWVCRSYSTMC
jgi:D-3-phosphoglycerate dehydrogenase